MSKATAASNKYIKLNSGHSIPQVGLGVYLTEADVASKVVKQALEVGYRHVDSATIYGNEAETAQGILDFLKENPSVKRSEIFYTTKIWEVDHGYESTKTGIAKSLEKAKGLEYIDLLLIHSPRAQVPGDDIVAKREKRLGTWKALQEAVEQGTVKSIGVSNYGAHHIKEILEWDGLKVKPAVNQIELHPWLQRTELVAFSRSHGIHLEAYSPLTKGRKFKDTVDPGLAALSKKYNKTPAQILIRWSIQQGFITLPKSVNLNRLIENFNVWDFEIAEDDLNSLGGKDLYELTSWDPIVDP